MSNHVSKNGGDCSGDKESLNGTVQHNIAIESVAIKLKVNTGNYAIDTFSEKHSKSFWLWFSNDRFCVIIVFSGTVNLIEDLISVEQYVLNELTDVSDVKNS